MSVLLFLLLPLAALSGWITGKYSSVNKTKNKPLVGPGYSANALTDKTVDVLVRMPTLDDETIETHISLGGMFRKRGEIERAIRLHQGIINRSGVSAEQQSFALLELARDYIAAGLLDRAEDILLELINKQQQLLASLKHLLELYQQGKEWLAAINIANRLQNMTTIDLRINIAHYYCELAEQELKTQQYKQAKYCLKKALKVKANFSRAIILFANIEQALGNYSKAIKLYNSVVTKNSTYFSVVVNDLIKCYQYVRENNFLYQQEAIKSKFLCKNCGFIAGRLDWYCPSCKQWETMVQHV